MSYRSPGNLFSPLPSKLPLHKFHNPPSHQPQLSMRNPLPPSGPSNFPGNYGPNFSNFNHKNQFISTIAIRDNIILSMVAMLQSWEGYHSPKFCLYCCYVFTVSDQFLFIFCIFRLKNQTPILFSTFSGGKIELDEWLCCEFIYCFGSFRRYMIKLSIMLKKRKGKTSFF